MLPLIILDSNSNQSFARVIANALSAFAARFEQFAVECNFMNSSLKRSDEEEFPCARFVFAFCRTDCYLKSFIRRDRGNARAARDTAFISRARSIVFIKNGRGSALRVRVNIE